MMDWTVHDKSQILDQLWSLLDTHLLQKWYPLAVDREYGGFFTNISYDWRILPDQEKMVVSQARHIWTTAKTAGFVPHGTCYGVYSRAGYRFLIEQMWDSRYGGFFQIRSRDGGWSDFRGWCDEKRAYGNAFGLFALAALYSLTHDPDILASAKTAFWWIEEHAFDPIGGGYFQFLSREGSPLGVASPYTGIASDGEEAGYKDQNSSIHLLEAYTELYQAWTDPHLRRQLGALLVLIRDTMVDPRGYLHLFFSRDWKPVSFRVAPAEIRERSYGLDHVSFGHDYETAFLMLEASHALGIENDVRTLAVAKRMLDHALENGWDTHFGGFVDGGYYHSESDACTIVKPTKNWWAQAEALNALLLFSRIFPEETKYREYFVREWEYVNNFVLDHVHGDWFEGGLDQEPHFRTGPKSHIWKCTYHTGRTLMNCITLLSGPKDKIAVPEEKKREMDRLVDHWKMVKGLLHEYERIS